jgi:hypothetical protein
MKIDRGNRTCPSATLSTTNPTWPDPGSNPGRRSGKTVTNRLSYGAAIWKVLRGHVLRSHIIASFFIPNWLLPAACPWMLLAGWVATGSSG